MLCIKENGELKPVSPVILFTPQEEPDMVIELPSEFNLGSEIYSFRVDSNTLLISRGQNTSGVYEYNINDKTLNKIYNSGAWKNFQIVNNKCLIGGSLGFLLYDINEKTINSFNIGNIEWNNFYVVGKDCLIGSSSYFANNGGVILYDGTNNEMRMIYTSDAWNFFTKIGNDVLISKRSTTSADKAVLLRYDTITKTLTELYSAPSVSFSIFISFDNFYLISGTRPNTGIFLYDMGDKSIQQVYNIGHSWNLFKKIGQQVLLSSSGYNINGILLYDIPTKTTTKIYESGYSWEYFHEFGDKCLISGDVLAPTGILLYDDLTKTITKIFHYNKFWKYYMDVQDGVLITSGNTDSDGILFYDSINNSITMIYSYNNAFGDFKINTDGNITTQEVGGNTVFIYDPISKTYSIGINVSMGGE